MRIKAFLFFFLIFLSGASHPIERRIYESNRAYEQGDWITYSATRFIRYVSLGNTTVYFASTGGIKRYNFFTNQWNYPWTVSNGLA